MKALELFNQGKLDEAVESATGFVRDSPKMTGGREILAELFCFRGDLVRADKQLETIALQNPDQAVATALLRQLIRAETSRREVWTEGRMPEFLGEPDDSLGQRLKSLVALQAGNLAEAADLAAEAEEGREPVAGNCNGNPFQDFRDLDDLCAGFFEVLTSTGKYFWVPVSRVISMEFAPATRPRDLLWRQCEMYVADGPSGFVYIPVRYFSTEDSQISMDLRLGRATEWTEGSGGLVQGVGQRMFGVDQDDVSIMELKTVTFDRDEDS